MYNLAHRRFDFITADPSPSSIHAAPNQFLSLRQREGASGDERWEKSSEYPVWEKTGRGRCPERQLIAERPSMINEAGGLLPREIPGILSICAHCGPIARCPVDVLCRFPLVILQQAA